MIRFEKAVAKDAQGLTEVQTRTFDDDTRQHGRGERGGPPGYDSVEWQIKIIGYGRYYKMLDDDTIIGGIIVIPEGKGHYELGRIYLLPEYQNRGIGTQAMQFVERTFPAKRWTLGTPCWAIRNHHFYEKVGYVKIGETPPDENGDFVGFLYEKHIPAGAQAS